MKIKQLHLLLLAALLVPVAAPALPKLAVLDMLLAPGMDRSLVVPVTDKIIEELEYSQKYLVFDRSKAEQVLREKEFQLSSGVVKIEDVRQAGEILGADLVVVASATRAGTTHVITAKMIDVANGEILAQSSFAQEGAIDVLLEVAREVGRELARLEAAEPAVARPEEAAAKSDPMISMQLQSLINRKAHMKEPGRLQMRQLANQLTEQDRLLLYTSNAKNNAGAVLLLNLLIPSLGSWFQGDVAGGLTELSLAVPAILGTGFGWPTYKNYSGEWHPEIPPFFYIGVGFIIIDVIYMCVRPFNYQKKWNTNLAKGLKRFALSFLDEEGSTFAVRATERGPEWKLGLNLVSFEY
jgi:TolB-like protein